MSKIGILTFHTANNFGAVLQAISLQNTIQDLNQEGCEFIDYHPDFIEKDYSLNPFTSKHPKTIMKNILRIKDKQTRNRKFYFFRRNKMIYGERISTESDFNRVSNQYSTIVVGSDQVWNYILTKSDMHYFLQGMDKKVRRYAYAACTGGATFHEEEAKTMLALLSDFSEISVREHASKEVLEEKLADKEIYVHLDPVFLTEKEKWNQLSVSPKKKDYILFFKMGYSRKADPALEFAKNLSAATGYKLLMLWDQEMWFQYREVEHIGAVGPDEFLGWIENARCVVTNSFHATAFCIILNTPFYVETDIDRKDRVLNLLNLFNLEKCGLSQGRTADGSVKIPDIAWEQANAIIANEKKRSIQFLENVVSPQN